MDAAQLLLEMGSLDNSIRAVFLSVELPGVYQHIDREAGGRLKEGMDARRRPERKRRGDYMEAAAGRE